MADGARRVHVAIVERFYHERQLYLSRFGQEECNKRDARKERFAAQKAEAMNG